MAKRLIISIDGGGIRGIIPLVVLRSLQARLNKDLDELTTSWYGTSTGAVIAAGLLLQHQDHFEHAVQNVLDIYEFRSTSAINPLGSPNPARALNKLLEENFGPFTFNEFPNLNVVATQLPQRAAHIFNRQNNVSLAEALKATCAVPTVFDPVQIGNVTFVDGFLVAKNPALLAIRDEQLNDDLVLLSLGTGILREVDGIEQHVRQTHVDLETLSNEKGFHYFRMNPHLVLAADDMQNTTLKNIFSLRKDTENFLRDKSERFDQLINLLNAI